MYAYFLNQNNMKIKSVQEKQWQAESDASTMAEYQAIMEDKPRLQRAIKAAKNKAQDLTQRASAMQKAASYGKGGRLSKGSKTTSKRRK